MENTNKPDISLGIAYLDANYPGWIDRIDLDRLSMSSPCNCVLGQLEGEYYRGIRRAFKPSQRDSGPPQFGFDIGNSLDDGEYESLTEAWRDAIRQRRGRKEKTHVRRRRLPRRRLPRTR